MNEFSHLPENEPISPRLKESTIRQVAANVYAELSFANDGDFECFSGGDPTCDDEDTLIRRLMGPYVSFDALDEAIEQYKQTVDEAGGLEAYLTAAAERRKAREHQRFAELTDRQAPGEEAPHHQNQETPPSAQHLGSSAVKRFFRR